MTRKSTRFLLFAVVEAKNQGCTETLMDLLRKDPSVTVKEARLLKVETPRRMPSEFYSPCPRDTFLTRQEIIEDESGEVYFGKCRNRHQLMLSATVRAGKVD